MVGCAKPFAYERSTPGPRGPLATSRRRAAWKAQIALRGGTERASHGLPSMSAHEFSVPLSRLDAAGTPFDFVIRPAWLRGELEGAEAQPSDKDGHFEVRLSRSGST